jgi:hypothetical protein
MTDLAIALAVMSGVVVGLFLFGTYWIRIERRQARYQSTTLPPSPPNQQQAIPFPERELAAMSGDR